MYLHDRLPPEIVRQSGVLAVLKILLRTARKNGAPTALCRQQAEEVARIIHRHEKAVALSLPPRTDAPTVNEAVHMVFLVCIEPHRPLLTPLVKHLVRMRPLDLLGLESRLWLEVRKRSPETISIIEGLTVYLERKGMENIAASMRRARVANQSATRATLGTFT